MKGDSQNNKSHKFKKNANAQIGLVCFICLIGSRFTNEATSSLEFDIRQQIQRVQMVIQESLKFTDASFIGLVVE